MYKVTLTLEVTTPLFMTGANQDKFELRATSIKSILRYWFRAMMGSLADVPFLKDLENQLFGFTEQTSKVKLKLLSKPQATKDLNIVDKGIAYLGYGFVKWNREKSGFVWEKDHLNPDAPNKQFNIKLIFLNQTDWQNYKAIISGVFWLLSHFGGLGARVRRGFGGVKIVNYETLEDDLDWNYTCTSTYFETNLKKIFCKFKEFAKLEKVNGTKEFTTFVDFKGVISETAWPNWKEALNAIGIFYREFREINKISYVRGRQIKLTKDYVNVVSDFLNNKLDITKTFDFTHDAFGLPIQYVSHHLNKKAILSWKEKVGGRWKEKDRRASPLFLRVLPCSDKGYKILVAFFNVKFLPNQAKEILKLSKDKQFLHVKKADTQIILKFLEAFKNRFGGEEINFVPGVSND